MTERYGGTGRVSNKAKLGDELVVLGQVLVNARERAGLKQQDVAARLGLPPSYLSKIENGTRRLDVVEFIRIARAIGADAAELLRAFEDELRSIQSGG